MIQEINKAIVPDNGVFIWFIGQEGIIIKGGNTVLCIDPYVSDYAEKELGLIRNYPPPIQPEDITEIDYYFITHDHLDHLDPGTVEVVAEQNPNTVFIAPAYCQRQLQELGVGDERFIRADTDHWIDKGKLKVKPIPAAHESFEEDTYLGHRFVGYIIQLNGVSIYHAGDTVVYSSLPEKLKGEAIDIGMLPINGRDTFRFHRGAIGNMNYREAAELAYLANFDLVIPLHFDVLADNSEKPGYFVDYIYENFPGQKFHVMARKEQFIYMKPN